MNNHQPSYKIAVILYPTDNNGDRWYSNIICNGGGPTSLNAARPYVDAFQHACDELNAMLDSIVSVDQVDVWTVRLTPEAAQELEAYHGDALFDAIDELPATSVINVQHETVVL